ncbi:hypothetical protein N7453_011168 [Penicillium expansum]|nr:hypothetical protein N7453_011168 [Penicillium expansum]
MLESLQMVCATGGKGPREDDSQAEGPQAESSNSKLKTKAQRSSAQTLHLSKGPAELFPTGRGSRENSISNQS